MTDCWESAERAIIEGQQRIQDKAEGDLDQIRQNVQRLLDESPLKVPDVALRAGLGENTVRGFLSGKLDTGIKNVLLTCRALDITLADLLPESAGG